MPKNNENKWLRFDQYFALPNQGLRSYFGRVRKGQPEVYRTTFYKDKSVQEVLDGWKPTLETLSDEWPSLVDFENDLAKKVGPMSVMKPLAQRMEDIDHYYDDILLKSSPISHSAISAVVREFSALAGLRPRGQSRTVDNMKKSTNSGSPYFTKRKLVVKSTLPCEVDSPNYQELNGDLNNAWLACAVLGWRGQEGGPTVEDVKQRVVWMFPFAVNICELQVYQPLIELCQRHNLVPAWISMDSVDERITKLFDTKAHDDLIICTDFSKFDQHFNPDMSEAGREILSYILDRSPESQDWLNNVYPMKYNIPLAYDWNRIRDGVHGMGSGSGGTNADETLVHRALQYEVAQKNNQKLNPNSMCLGDDGILSYPGITVEQVVASYTSHGQEMNTDKQGAATDYCTYLRRWHHTNYRKSGICVGVYSTYRALGRLMMQERFYDPKVWGPKMVALRQLSILENVKFHPLKEQFVRYCMKGDKFRLGLDIPGFLDDIEHTAQEATEYMPDFLGYTKSEMRDNGGIGDWWIVNYLKSLA